MNRVIFALAATVALALAIVSSPTQAQQLDFSGKGWNKLTCVTFSAPVQLPGVTLPAGSYLFQHMDATSSPGDYDVIQVVSGDRKMVIGTFLTVPEPRQTPTADTVVTFAETPAGTPEAIKTWFYPNELVGEEFVYPQSDALNLAKASHTAVLSSSSPLPTVTSSTLTQEQLKTLRSASVSRINETGKTEAVKSATAAKSATMKSVKASRSPGVGATACQPS